MDYLPPGYSVLANFFYKPVFFSSHNVSPYLLYVNLSYFTWVNEQLNTIFYVCVLILQCSGVTSKSDKQRCSVCSLYTSQCKDQLHQPVLPCN